MQDLDHEMTSRSPQHRDGFTVIIHPYILSRIYASDQSIPYIRTAAGKRKYPLTALDNRRQPERVEHCDCIRIGKSHESRTKKCRIRMNMLLKLFPRTGIGNITASFSCKQKFPAALTVFFYQCCPETASGRQNRCSHPCSPASDYHHVIFDNTHSCSEFYFRKIRIIFYICVHFGKRLFSSAGRAAHS